MRFLVFDKEGAETAIAWRLQEYEHHDVRFLAQKEGKEHLLNMVQHVDTLEEGLRWVKDGVIICGDEQDCSDIRGKGFRVYGGNKFTERLENDRIFELEVAKRAGLQVPNFHHIETIDEGIAFIKKHPYQYVLKQMGNAPKQWNYVGRHEDGSDVIDQLEWIKTRPEFEGKTKLPFILQEIVDGIEFAVGAWWIGDDWKKDDKGNVLLYLNKEHKKSGNDDIGLTCGEAGTVGKFTTTEDLLFRLTLDKLTPILKKECPDVSLCIDAACGIVEEDGKPYLFEFTPRQPYPGNALQQHLLDMPSGDFFEQLADGVQGNIDIKETWGVVTVLGAGRYPFESKEEKGSFHNQPVEFPTDEWDEHIAPGYIKYDPERDFFRIADIYEDVCQVAYDDECIEVANLKCVETMKKVKVRAANYRTDIGKEFRLK